MVRDGLKGGGRKEREHVCVCAREGYTVEDSKHVRPTHGLLTKKWRQEVEGVTDHGIVMEVSMGKGRKRECCSGFLSIKMVLELKYNR